MKGFKNYNKIFENKNLYVILIIKILKIKN